MLPQRRSIRLFKDVYRTPGQAFSVTVAVTGRRQVFADVGFGATCVALLRELCGREAAPCYAYCLMPDHVHLLLGVGPNMDLCEFIGTWKSRCFTARRTSGNPTRFWQRSFYDRAVRGDEDLLQAARYILENPVRAGLVTQWRDYALSGSFEFDL